MNMKKKDTGTRLQFKNFIEFSAALACILSLSVVPAWADVDNDEDDLDYSQVLINDTYGGTWDDLWDSAQGDAWSDSMYYDDWTSGTKPAEGPPLIADVTSYPLDTPIVRINSYSTTPILSAPRAGSATITTAQFDETFLLLQELGNGWNKVKYDGQEGYVQSSVCTKDTSVILQKGLTDRAKLVLAAYHYLGSKYIFGSQNPSVAFDCSLLMQTIYRETLGIKIGRSTREQIHQGTPIPVTQLQPGDLIFYGDGSSKNDSSVNHVSMYVGSDYTIQARGTGIGCTRTLWYKNPRYIKFVRILPY